MKVLTLSTVFPSAERPLHGLFVYERVRATAAHHDIRVIAPVAWLTRGMCRVRRLGGRLAILHPTYYYVPGIAKCLDGFWLFLSILPTARRLRKRFRPDLIDAHFGHPEGVAAVLLGAWLRRPVAITLRGSEFDHSQYRLRRWILAWALRRADLVIALSWELEALAKRLGVADDRLTVIENGVDTGRFLPMNREASRRLCGIAGNGRILVSVGHLVPRKGFHRIIEVLPALRTLHPGLRLIIVGGPTDDTRYPRRLRALVTTLALTDDIVFAGAAAPDQVARWLNAADLFVLASQREGCPNVVLEALACGTPVVCTRVGDIERLLPPDAGVLVDPPEDSNQLKEAITLALSRTWSPELIRRSVEQSTWPAVASRVVARWRVGVSSNAMASTPKLPPGAGEESHESQL